MDAIAPALDGRAGEVNQVVGAMSSLRAMCAERNFLLVGDTKLVSYDNLNKIIAAGVTFIAPASKAYVSTDTLGISPSAGRVVMKLEGTAVPTRAAERRRGWCEAASSCTS